MSLLRTRPRLPVYRPELPPAPVLAEIVAPDFDQRFDACVAVTATIWGHGYRMCRTPLEKREWMTAYCEYLKQLMAACSGPTGRGP